MIRFFTLLLAASCLTAVGQVPDYVPTDGLVAWYNLNGEAMDVSGSGMNAETINAVPTEDRFESPNSAFYFSGSQDLILIPDDQAFLQDLPSLTVSVWIRADTYGGKNIVSKGNNVTESYRSFYLFGPNEDKHLRFRLNCGEAGFQGEENVVGNKEIQVFEWVHVVGTYDGTHMRLYCDGELDGEVLKPGSIKSVTSPMTIGNNLLVNDNLPNVDWYAFQGRIDDLGIWNRSLSALEIQFLYSNSNPAFGCTDESSCSYCPEANVDDGSCLYFDSCGICGGESVGGCLDMQACNYNLDAICDDGSCDYSCCPGPGCCDVGTEWSWESNTCIVTNPADINFDGCVQLNDLLDLLGAYGDCGAEESTWQCGDPLEYQGYEYATVQIGEQCWFAENARYLPAVSPVSVGSEDDGLAHAYVYDYDGANVSEAMTTFNYEVYGALYNSKAAQEWSLCPTGWHPGQNADWELLEQTLGMEADEIGATQWRGTDEGYKLKSLEGWNSDGNGTDSFSFTALPGGYRNEGSSFALIASNGYWWSGVNEYRMLESQENRIWRATENPDRAFSVRCIKNAE